MSPHLISYTPHHPPGETPKESTPTPSEQQGEFVPYNATAQKIGGFAAGRAIGPVPFGSLVANLMIDKGVLAPGAPEGW